MSDRTYQEAAAELNISQSWLENRVQARQIPHRRYGRAVRFTDADIDAIRAMHQEAPINAAPVLSLARRRAA